MKIQKFVAYYRVSTAKQGTSGLGLEAQQEAVVQFLRGSNAALVGAYMDIESGTRKGNKRPELAKAIAHAKREKATLVIAKLDRLARNVAFVSNLMESGIDFVAVDNPEMNKLVIHILAAVAENEAEMISRRTKEALAAARARGIKLGTPANLTKEAQATGAQSMKLKAVSDYSGLTPKILKMRQDGFSFGLIAKSLNESGEVTRQGTLFHSATIKRICDRAV